MNGSKHKICIITGNLGQGGAERQLFYILKTLQLMGEIPVLICLTQGDYWEKRISELGIPVIWAGKSQSRIIRMMRILQIISKIKPKIIQSQHFYTNIYASLTARYFGINDIGAIRNDTLREIQSLGILGPISLKLPQILAVNSLKSIQIAQYYGVPAEKLFLLSNVIDTELFRPIRIFPQNKSVINVISVGRLEPQKRPDRLLRIACKCHESNPFIRFHIFGDGSLKETLISIAKNANLLENTVFFHGRNNNIQQFYRYSDIFLLTSDYEGTPNVILEAMSSGLPIVATLVGDIDILVKNETNGFVVENNNEEELVNAVLSLAANCNLRISMGGRNRDEVVEKYSLNKLSIALKELYSRVSSDGK